ncbi:hypothetical protein V6259_19285 [Marinomonas sp. TI.3.20]|uniref:hypothetical protein n=1 Tax=Marinomonas sp. TI.3.20 TaxID=3121296 RepID=UPI00311EECDC
MEELNSLFTRGDVYKDGFVFESIIKITPEDLLFDIHFPKMPIMPGACLIAYAALCLEEWSNLGGVRIKCVPRASFNHAVIPNMELKLQIVSSPLGEKYKKAVCRYISNQGVSALIVFEYLHI